MLCMRHSKTKYTQVFPDLTEEGADLVRTFGTPKVREWMDRHGIDPDAVSIVSSPAPRAHGTADLIREGIGHRGEIELSERIEPLRWKDPARCASIIKEMVGYINLETEPRFADHTLFEPLSEVHGRWASFLLDALERRASTGEMGHNMVVIAHYETFCGLISEMFQYPPEQKTELKHIEPISLEFYSGFQGGYLVKGSFRETMMDAFLRHNGRWSLIGNAYLNM